MLKCETCKVEVNSQGQLEVHLSGKLHAKKLRQQMGGDAPPPPSPSAAQNSNRGRGRGGRGGGSLMRGGKKGRGGPINFVAASDQQRSQQQGPPGFGQQGADSYGPQGFGQRNPDGQQQGYMGGPADQQFPSGNQGYGTEQNQQQQQHQPFSLGNGINSAPPVQNPNTTRDPLYCSNCCKKFNSPDQAVAHFTGSRHFKKVKSSGQVDCQDLQAVAKMDTNVKPTHAQFSCVFCNITVNSPQQMDVHRLGTKHLMNVAQRKRHADDAAEAEPVRKRPAGQPDLTAIPHVDPAQILPFDQMFPTPAPTTTGDSAAVSL